MKVDALREVEAQHHKRTGCKHGQRHAHQLRTLGKVLQCIHGGHAGYRLYDHKLVVRVQGKRRQDDGANHSHEGRARVHEYAHKHGHHGKRQHIHVEELVVDHNVGQQREKGQ